MPPISFEFYPPKTDAQREQLHRTAARLAQYHPDYVSVTFGAGGSTLSYTPETIAALRDEHGLDATPHVSCIGGTRSELAELLDAYRDGGCTRLVALRGDLPSGMARTGDFHYASDLVSFIRARYGDHFHIAVGCYPETHPQAEDAFSDLAHFKHKVDAGASAAITQYFYNADAYFRFVDDVRAMGVSIPIVPGIMPITNFEGIVRFSRKCGADIPRWMFKRLEALADDEAGLRDFGIDTLTRMCAELIEAGAPGLHFYTLNRWGATRAICNRLGLLTPDS
ncbi:MAG: methylenetetrahydrofolate reductase [NAD(P)H] [Pseudomonadales bacterium]|nr:methylenetetrahydrofolate reductase [NAD(P)H] [Pseudomonadales bacterium]